MFFEHHININHDFWRIMWPSFLAFSQMLYSMQWVFSFAPGGPTSCSLASTCPNTSWVSSGKPEDLEELVQVCLNGIIAKFCRLIALQEQDWSSLLYVMLFIWNCQKHRWCQEFTLWHETVRVEHNGPCISCKICRKCADYIVTSQTMRP